MLGDRADCPNPNAPDRFGPDLGSLNRPIREKPCREGFSQVPNISGITGMLDRVNARRNKMRDRAIEYHAQC